jgi:hypothetical protein
VNAETRAKPESAVAQPDPELKRLEPLLGRWSTSAQTEDTILGPGVPVTSVEEFFWLEGGYFLVQTYETVFGDEPPQAGVNYWYFDPKTGKFRIIFFSNNGPYSEEGNRYTGTVDRATLTFEGPARFQYRLDDEGKVEKNPDGTISVVWWLRDEHGDWQQWMTNTFSRVKG